MEHLKIKEILPNPFQPRQVFPIEELGELAKSIKEYGIIEPLIVRINEKDEFELIAGERRLRAAKMAGLLEVPVILKDYDDKKTAQIALIENLQRSDLNALEEARAYQTLIDNFSMTQDELSQKVSKSRSHIANFLRLLKLSKAVQAMIIDKKLNMGQAKPLLALTDAKLQLEIAKLIVERELSARKAEALVKKVLSDTASLETIQRKAQEEIYVKSAKEKLKQVLGTNVNIKQGKKKSCIEIEFYSEADLERLLEIFLKDEELVPTSRPRKIIDFSV